MKKILIFILSVPLLVIVPLVAVACSSSQQPPAPGPVTDYTSLVDNLRATGASVNPVGEVQQPFFSVKGLVIKVNDNDVQVFEYSDATAAENEAKSISPDGSSVGTSMPFWVAPPHFYKVEKLIILYVGENEDTIGILESVLGPQFAGRPPKESAPVPPTGGDTPLAPTTGEPEPVTPLQIEVIIQGSTFIPDTQNIPAGALVLWYNDDSVDHTVTARDNSFDSGRISPNETFEYIFEQPGEVEYYCKIHPSMVGKITIE